MSKRFRRYKNFLKNIRKMGKLTFDDYKEVLHRRQKRKNHERKNFLKAKSMLRQGRKYVVVGDAIYYWGNDKKSVVALVPDFDGIRRAFEMIKKREEEEQ